VDVVAYLVPHRGNISNTSDQDKSAVSLARDRRGLPAAIVYNYPDLLRDAEDEMIAYYILDQASQAIPAADMARFALFD
jgi:hypothetical protein